MTYAFLLGREPLLSFAELSSVCTSQGVSAEPATLLRSIAQVEGDEEQIKLVFNRLGGSIKLGKLLDEIPLQDFVKNPVACLTRETFLQQALDRETSVAFAMSVFGNAPQGFQKKVKSIGLQLKSQLKSKFSHVRFVVSAEKIISSVTVKRNKLLRGLDLWIVFSQGNVLLFKTIAVQDYREFARHDYQRPASDAASGMLPPKLARMMVNLSSANEQSVLYDPFVGSGTVLQEAALLGITNVRASDIDRRAVANTQANMKWLLSQYKLKVSLDVVHAPIEKLDPKKYTNVTHIVAEIDLGPALKKPPTREEASNFGRESSELVRHTLVFASRLPKLSRIVLAIPFWPMGKGSQFIDLELPKGFAIHFLDSQKLALYAYEHSDRGGYIYLRPGQFVGREVLVVAR